MLYKLLNIRSSKLVRKLCNTIATDSTVATVHTGRALIGFNAAAHVSPSPLNNYTALLWDYKIQVAPVPLHGALAIRLRPP